MDCSKEQLREEWLAALESDDYRQTCMWLQAGDRYCCLGVACKVAERHGVEVIKDEFGDGIAGSSLAVQEAVKAAFGFRHGKGGIVNGKSLAEHNDAGRSFKEIATLVRTNPTNIWGD